MRKVAEELVMYRYHEREEGSLTWATAPEVVWKIRLEAIARQLLLGPSAPSARYGSNGGGGEGVAAATAAPISAFSIWGAGRDAKRFCRQLLARWPELETALKAMLEVDQKKIKHGVFDFEKPASQAGRNAKTETDQSKGGKTAATATAASKKRKRGERIRVPIVHFTSARALAPAIVLVKGGGLHPGLEENLEEFRKRNGGNSNSIIFFN